MSGVDKGLAGLIVAVIAIFGVGQASASTASFQKVQGKPTLVLQAKRGETNAIFLKAEGKKIELRETGDLPNFRDIEMDWAAGSLPGCEFSQEFDDPAYGMVTCEAGKVRQVLLLLGDWDDYLQTGEAFSTKGKPSIPIFVRGGKGDDQLNGGLGNDFLFGDGGNDIIAGYKGNDKVSGGAGADSLAGEESYTSDTPPARGGNDLLIGGPGNDNLDPGSGRDMVRAGAGRDIVGSVIDRDRDVVDCGSGPNDSLLGVNNRGYRIAEKGIVNCETVSNGMFGGWVWKCRRNKCLANATPFAVREEP